MCHQAAGFNASSASFGVEATALRLCGVLAAGSSWGGDATGSGTGANGVRASGAGAANGFVREAGAGLNIGASIAPLMPLSVAIVARCTSSVWIVVRSMLALSSSHCSTARRSAMRLSSSSTSTVGAIMLGICCGSRAAIDARLPGVGMPLMPHNFCMNSKVSPIAGKGIAGVDLDAMAAPRRVLGWKARQRRAGAATV